MGEVFHPIRARGRTFHLEFGRAKPSGTGVPRGWPMRPLASAGPSWGKEPFDHGEELLAPGGMDFVASASDRDEATPPDQLAQRLQFLLEEMVVEPSSRPTSAR
jgi:hypothetical protein